MFNVKSIVALLFYFIILSVSAKDMSIRTEPTIDVEDRNLTGIFWEIRYPNVSPSYLLGTMHTEDQRVTQLSDVIWQRFEQADSASFEILMEAGQLLQSVQLMFLDSGRSLKDIVANEAHYDILISRLEKRGIPEIALRRLKPWAVMVTVSMPETKTGEILDLMLFQQAKLSSKAVYGLESVKEQLGFFDALTTDEQLILLEETLNQLEEMPDFFEQLHELYLKRNLGEMLAFYREGLAKSEYTELMDKFHHGLVSERNSRMLTRMLPRLREGNAFIAVGALHLPGEGGLLDLLQQQGYVVVGVH
ncbi:TraB/GumN family protein [Thioflexithrix psekupsensis]|uniref:TraB/GumN family protein n=1 Tax=Thioflexithrix psekupsensis TaxID=1570016 RepID=A0A251X8Z6_9GAMM|nr:TraB/GumN family protein [Thioflexithrix psekupsensis]OUD14197.1 hypothetical protein TPSD3_07655 [Thioflexithrix psekupsensis]